MKRIAVFCVTYHSDRELEQYLTSLRRAQEYSKQQKAHTPMKTVMRIRRRFSQVSD